MNEPNNNKKNWGSGVFHPSARPMKIQRDKNGGLWLCDGDCKPDQPCAASDCWPLDKVIFERGG